MVLSRPMNRRHFFCRTLRLAAAAGVSWFEVPRIWGQATQAPKPPPYGGFPLGLQSFSLRGFGPEGALDRVKELGLVYVELFRLHFPPTEDTIKIKEMKTACAQRGISISAHGVQTFTQDHNTNEAFFRFAKAAGISIITANPTEDAFDSLDRLVAHYDVRVAIHNHGPGSRYETIDSCVKAVRGHDPRIGFTADLGHFLRANQDPIEAIERLSGRLYGIHLKDVAERKKDTVGVVLGKGQLDVLGTFRALKRVRFPADGAFSLEYEENPDDPMPGIRACLEVAAEMAAKAV